MKVYSREAADHLHRDILVEITKSELDLLQQNKVLKQYESNYFKRTVKIEARVVEDER